MTSNTATISTWRLFAHSVHRSRWHHTLFATLQDLHLSVNHTKHKCSDKLGNPGLTTQTNRQRNKITLVSQYTSTCWIYRRWCRRFHIYSIPTVLSFIFGTTNLHSLNLVWFLPRCSMQPVFPIAKVSVCLSVCHSVNCDKTNESSAEILIPHER